MEERYAILIGSIKMPLPNGKACSLLTLITLHLSEEDLSMVCGPQITSLLEKSPVK
jgi:hypothetical protein